MPVTDPASGEEVVSGMELPTCSKGTCTGHREDDVLEFSNLYDGQDKLFTNREFYELTSPTSDFLPYVYNSLSHWPGCYGSTLNITTDRR